MGSPPYMRTQRPPTYPGGSDIARGLSDVLSGGEVRCFGDFKRSLQGDKKSRHLVNRGFPFLIARSEVISDNLVDRASN